jgi:nucleotide-binding universal stress UspA family protein
MMWKPIVVGVDGSRESGIAAGAAWLLAQAAGVACLPVHATRDVRSADEFASTGIPFDALELAMLRLARSEVVASLRSHVPTPVTESLVVRAGRTLSVLQEVIAQTDGQMLVLGGKHHSALGRWLGGSTVQKAVRHLDLPLLITKGELRTRPRVLVAVDTSYAAPDTINEAITFARLLGGPLHALHVVEPAVTVPDAISVPNPPDYDAWSRERVERDLWPLLPVPDQHKVIRRGPAVDTITQEAAAWRADVIVVGSHGRGWIDRLLIGSVTEDLLNNLPAAVLVIPVPAPAGHEQMPSRLRVAAATT